MKMKLEKHEIEAFQRDGFIGPLRAFSAEEIDLLVSGLGPILAGKEPTHHRHLNNKDVYALCTAPGIVGRIESLIGPDILLWSSNFFVKEPGARETPWHQDQNNGVPPAIEPPLNFSVWLALDDVHAENSCLKFVVGSHLRTVNHASPADGHYFGLAETNSFDLSTAANMELKKGEFVIFTDRVLHSAEPNRSEKRRAGLAMRFTAPFVKVLRNIKSVVVSGEDRFGFSQTQSRPF